MVELLPWVCSLPARTQPCCLPGCPGFSLSSLEFSTPAMFAILIPTVLAIPASWQWLMRQNSPSLSRLCWASATDPQMLREPGAGRWFQSLWDWSQPVLGFNFSVSFQTPTSGSELLWTRQEALCHESRASRPVLECISHQEHDCGLRLSQDSPPSQELPCVWLELAAASTSSAQHNLPIGKTPWAQPLPLPQWSPSRSWEQAQPQRSAAPCALAWLLPVPSCLFWDELARSECSVSRGCAGSRAWAAAGREGKGRGAAGSAPQGHE